MDFWSLWRNEILGSLHRWKRQVISTRGSSWSIHLRGLQSKFFSLKFINFYSIITDDDNFPFLRYQTPILFSQKGLLFSCPSTGCTPIRRTSRILRNLCPSGSSELKNSLTPTFRSEEDPECALVNNLKSNRL